jgi:hypothetical protein
MLYTFRGIERVWMVPVCAFLPFMSLARRWKEIWQPEP